MAKRECDLCTRTVSSVSHVSILNHNRSSPSLVHAHSIHDSDAYQQWPQRWSITHVVFDADVEMGSGDMLAAAGRTPTA